jgi:hypothetical protein
MKEVAFEVCCLWINANINFEVIIIIIIISSSSSSSSSARWRSG